MRKKEAIIIQKVERKSKNAFYVKFFFFFSKIVPFMRQYGKYDTAAQATFSNTIWRMRFACWITKATHTNTHSHTHKHSHTQTLTHTHTHTHTHTLTHTHKHSHTQTLTHTHTNTHTLTHTHAHTHTHHTHTHTNTHTHTYYVILLFQGKGGYQNAIQHYVTVYCLLIHGTRQRVSGERHAATTISPR